MKKFLLMTLVVMVGLTMFGQEVRFPPAIVSAGGSTDGSGITQTRWRLAPVHVITFNVDDKVKSDLKSLALPKEDWNVSIYPNPVGDHLYLEFELPEQREFILKITDVVGRVIYVQEERTFINGSIEELNMSNYSPTLYLLHIFSSDLTSSQVYRIQKL
jgi:hypothetical protein